MLDILKPPSWFPWHWCLGSIENNFGLELLIQEIYKLPMHIHCCWMYEFCYFVSFVKFIYCCSHLTTIEVQSNWFRMIVNLQWKLWWNCVFICAWVSFRWSPNLFQDYLCLLVFILSNFQCSIGDDNSIRTCNQMIPWFSFF